MSWKIEFVKEDGILHLKAEGVMNIDLIKQMSSQAIGYAVEYGTNKYLVDLRKMVPEVSTMNIHDLPKILRDFGLTLRSRIAVLFSPSSEKKEDFSFFETVSLNRGLQVRLFMDPDEALQWLKDD